MIKIHTKHFAFALVLVSQNKCCRYCFECYVMLLFCSVRLFLSTFVWESVHATHDMIKCEHTKRFLADFRIWFIGMFKWSTLFINFPQFFMLFAIFVGRNDINRRTWEFDFSRIKFIDHHHKFKLFPALSKSRKFCEYLWTLRICLEFREICIDIANLYEFLRSLQCFVSFQSLLP